MKKLLTVLLVLGLWGCSSKKDTGSDTNNQENVKVEEKQQAFSAMTLEEHMKIYTDQGLSEKDAMKAVAKDRGVTKRDIYSELKTKDR